MRTLIDTDDNILKEAMMLVGARTKRETIHLALQELIKSRYRQNLRKMAGSGSIEMTQEQLKGLRTRRKALHEDLVRGS